MLLFFENFCNIINAPSPKNIEINTNDQKLKLGHSRLSILDLTNLGHQPMSSYSGRFIISFNGEIYNHNILRKNINNEFNLDWKSTSDTETLVNLFEFYSFEKVLNMIEGIFAFILCDKINSSACLASIYLIFLFKFKKSLNFKFFIFS